MSLLVWVPTLVEHEMSVTDEYQKCSYSVSHLLEVYTWNVDDAQQMT